jgi:hypothetical protein
MKEVAIHEAGHVVLASAFGYSCSQMKIDSATGDAITKLDWGQDEITINAFLHPDTFGNAFNSQPQNKRAETPKIGGRYIMILCAGSCVEAYFKNKVDIDNGTIKHLPIEMGAGDPLLRTDIDKIERTEKFLKIIGSEIPLQNRQNQLLTIYTIIKQDEFYSAIDALAELLINSDSLNITKNEIEECLDKFNYSI